MRVHPVIAARSRTVIDKRCVRLDLRRIDLTEIRRNSCPMRAGLGRKREEPHDLLCVRCRCTLDCMASCSRPFVRAFVLQEMSWEAYTA